MQMCNRLSPLLWENDICSKIKLLGIFKDLFHQNAAVHELENVLFNYITDVNSDLHITSFDLLRFYGASMSIFTANQLFLSTRVQKPEDKIHVLDQWTMRLLCKRIIHKLVQRCEQKDIIIQTLHHKTIMMQRTECLKPP